MELSGKHKAELAGARVQRAALQLSVLFPIIIRRLLPSLTSTPRYLGARLVNLHPSTLELGTSSISPDAQLINLSR